MKSIFLKGLIVVTALAINCFGESAAVPASTETPVAVVVAAPKKAEAVEAGFGKIKLNGLLQIWYYNDNMGAPIDSFRLRRAEIKLSGEINQDVNWAVMFDPAQVREDDTSATVVPTSATVSVTNVGRKSVLQDFVISLKPAAFLTLDFGQYKIPFGMEGLTSSAALDFVERANLTAVLKWGDRRDVGVTAKFDFDIGGIKIKPAVGIYNGEGQNKLDVEGPVDLVGRLVIEPVKDIQIGLARYEGKKGLSQADNFQSGIELKMKLLNELSVYGEYAMGRDSAKDKTTYYAAAVYTLVENLQVAVRYDFYDPNINVAADDRTEVVGGLNYFIEKNKAKLQLNYVYRVNSADAVRANVQISY
ncbi:MAG: hypothetical protein A2452_06600 [Candidatus Firestonebacteria bacterium RIFOXYC2_FULL_39_67]|nr:MAG: hypothetical protein A2452_06600 [Candidatus Firestonebacteria bacterium RIFOXYC2_FULL_39_67]